MQWLNKSENSVSGLYHILVNPSLPRAYTALMGRCLNSGTGTVRVAIYTRRQLLVKYTSQFRDSMVNLQWDPTWHQHEQVYIPSHIRNGDEVMEHYSGPELLAEESTDVLRSLQRLLSARDAIKAALKLDENPVTVVTANEKIPAVTTADIVNGRRGSVGRSYKSVLFDDNVCLMGEEGVVTVEPFIALEEAQGDALAAYLRTHLPLNEVSPSASPIPASQVQGTRPVPLSLSSFPSQPCTIAALLSGELTCGRWQLCEDEDLMHFLLSAPSSEACLVENSGVVNYRIPYRVITPFISFITFCRCGLPLGHVCVFRLAHPAPAVPGPLPCLPTSRLHKGFPPPPLTLGCRCMFRRLAAQGFAEAARRLRHPPLRYGRYCITLFHALPIHIYNSDADTSSRRVKPGHGLILTPALLPLRLWNISHFPLYIPQPTRDAPLSSPSHVLLPKLHRPCASRRTTLGPTSPHLSFFYVSSSTDALGGYQPPAGTSPELTPHALLRGEFPARCAHGWVLRHAVGASRNFGGLVGHNGTAR